MAENIHPTTRDVLIEHMDNRKVPVRRKAGGARWTVLHHLLSRQYIKYHFDHRAHFPTHTVMTEKGREVLAKLLADWADALCRAGYAINPRDSTFATPAIEIEQKAQP